MAAAEHGVRTVGKGGAWGRRRPGLKMWVVRQQSCHCRRLGLIHQAVNPNNAITFGTRDIFEQKVGCVGVEMVGFAACFMINARALPAKLIHKHLISKSLCGDQISRISSNAHREFGGWIRQVRDFQQVSVEF